MCGKIEAEAPELLYLALLDPREALTSLAKAIRARDHFREKRRLKSLGIEATQPTNSKIDVGEKDNCTQMIKSKSDGNHAFSLICC